MAATLANGGVNPLTKTEVIDAQNVPGILAVMATAGLYDDAGKWLFHTGLPAKSGVGGGIIAVAPGKFGSAACGSAARRRRQQRARAESDRRRLRRTRRQPLRGDAALTIGARSRSSTRCSPGSVGSSSAGPTGHHAAEHRNADDRRQSAAVGGIALQHHDRTAKARPRSGRVRKVRPPRLPLPDRYHSVRSRIRRAAAETAGSACRPTSSQTRLIASVIASGSCRDRYSATASA